MGWRIILEIPDEACDRVHCSDDRAHRSGKPGASPHSLVILVLTAVGHSKACAEPGSE
jgi:hypothetical protein